MVLTEPKVSFLRKIMEQELCVNTKDGLERFLCVLRNEKEGIYQILKSVGEDNPEPIEWSHGKASRIFLYDGLKVEGKDVYAFTSVSTKLHKLGTLAGG